MLTPVDPVAATLTPMSNAVSDGSVWWTMSDSGTVAALAISVLALLLSWLSFRRQVGVHPQPKLVVEWSERLHPDDTGLLLREAFIVNHGDERARDLRVDIEFTAQSPWLRADVLEPAERLRLEVPVVDGVSWGEGSEGVAFQRHGDPTTYRFVTPRITMRWRQAPFRGKLHTSVELAPHTPNMLDGELS